MNINVINYSVLAFPVSAPVSIALTYHLMIIPQVESVRYLGVIYDRSLNWRPYIM